MSSGSTSHNPQRPAGLLNFQVPVAPTHSQWVAPGASPVAHCTAQLYFCICQLIFLLSVDKCKKQSRELSKCMTSEVLAGETPVGVARPLTGIAPATRFSCCLSDHPPTHSRGLINIWYFTAGACFIPALNQCCKL